MRLQQFDLLYVVHHWPIGTVGKVAQIAKVAAT